MTTEPILGVDLGSTCRCAALERGEPEVVPCGADGAGVPAAVSVADDGDVVVGRAAARRAALHPERTLADAFAPLGRRDAVALGCEEYVPEGLAAAVLRRMRRDAAGHLDGTVRRAVLAVPSPWDARRRRAVEDAAEIAGLDVERILPGPVAAATGWGFADRADRRVLVCDVGGSTVDVGLADLGGGIVEVIAARGDPDFGGRDVDRAVADHLLETLADERTVDPTDPGARWRVREAVADARVDFATRDRAAVFVPNVARTDAGRVDLRRTLSRGEFDAAAASALGRLEGPVVRTLSDAGERGAGGRGLDGVVLVGDRSWSPPVEDRVVGAVRRETGDDVDVARADVAVAGGGTREAAVALGAAVHGGVLAGSVDDVATLDVAPLSLGVAVAGGGFEPLVERATTIPTEEAKTFTTTADGQPAAGVRVLEGEDAVLGEVLVEDLPSAPAGEPEIEVTLSVDENRAVAVHVELERRATVRERAVGTDLGLRTEVLVDLQWAMEGNGPAAGALRHPGGPVRRDPRGPVAGADGTTAIVRRFDNLEDVDGVGEDLAEHLREAGYGSVRDLADADRDELTAAIHPFVAAGGGEDPLARAESVADTITEALKPYGGADGAGSVVGAGSGDRAGPDGEADDRGSAGSRDDGASDPDGSADRLSEPIEFADDLDEVAVERLLDVRDDLKRAVAADADDPAVVRSGVEMTRRRLDGADGGPVAAVRRTLADVAAGDADDAGAVRRRARDAVDRIDAVLADAAVEVVDPDPGTSANPDRHRVVGSEPAEYPEGHVVEVVASGYARDGTVRRPAKVRVSDGG